MLPDTPDVEAILLGPSGAASAAQPGTLFIDMSTIAPLATRRIEQTLADSGHRLLDAPVSGGQRGAVKKSLSIMVGGSKADFQSALPILNALGTTVVHVGPVGAGQVAKACNQLVVGSTIQAVAEALVLARKAGVDPEKVREALLGGFASSRVLEAHGRRMLDKSFDPGFRAKLHLKDARIILQTCEELSVAAPAFAVVAEALQRLVDTGRGDLDHAALVTLVEGDALEKQVGSL
jgi:2-hydroxy-3-oxopropionate reductase